MKALFGLVVAGVLTCLIGCCGKGSDEADDGPDPNAAVAAAHWGEERVLYSADLGWLGERMVPTGRQWESPPTDTACVKCTYYGPKLVRVEGRDLDGEPRHISKLGVRIEWTYAAHGGIVEQVAYEEDGTVTLREQYRYDEAGRCIAGTMWEYGEKRTRSTYLYNEGGLSRTDRMEVYGPDGTVLSVHTAEERWNPSEESWERVEE